jgi:uncharacterized protein YaaR (DUF327 family)
MKIANIQQMNKINTQNQVTEKNNDDFNKSMDDRRSIDVKQKLKNLLERIDTQASKLTNRMDLTELKEYKRLIGEFLNLAVNNSHKFTRERTLDKRGRYRVFSIVKKVNEELDNLTTEVLKKEKNRINILTNIDDIRGMLLDVIM